MIPLLLTRIYNYDKRNFRHLRREDKACEERSIFVCIMANQTIQKSFSREMQ
jgi:hypothetical protein